MVDLNPQIGRNLRVLMQPPGFVKNPICIADFPGPELINEMDTVLREMHMADQGRQLPWSFSNNATSLLGRSISLKPNAFSTDTGT